MQWGLNFYITDSGFVKCFGWGQWGPGNFVLVVGRGQWELVTKVLGCSRKKT